MAKNVISGRILACLTQIYLWVLPPLGVRNCCKLSTKTYDPNSTYGKKLHFEPDYGPWTQIWAIKIFCHTRVVRYCSKHHPMQFKGKLMKQT